jgi:acyl carrier protein
VNPDDARELIHTVLHGIAPEVELDLVDPDAMLQDEMEIDSMDFLNFVTAIHQRTGVEVPERDYPELASLNGAIAYLTDRAA